MKHTDVLVIGSSAAGLVAATTSKRINKSKTITVVTKLPKAMIPCGIPYIFGTVGSSEKNILPADKAFAGAGIEMIVDEVTGIDRENKKVSLADGEDISYDKLVIGTGSSPNHPQWLNGHGMENVFTVPKVKDYLDVMQEKLGDCKNVVVVGAGFIGVEMSDELKKAGKNVTLVEKQEHILSLAFDSDISMKAEELVVERGVKLITGKGIKSILGDDKVTGVALEDGVKLEADAVVLSMGYTPNVDFAKAAGLRMSSLGFIKVDEYMRTDDPDIFATGDCAEKRDFITRKPCATMLASTACAEARIAGMNIFKLSAIKTFSGTISIFSTALGDSGFGTAGITETIAHKENLDVVTGVFEGIDRHPGTLADTHKQYVKLIAGKESGQILGGEVYGGLSAGELVNTLGVVIQNRMTLNQLITSQIGTHPLMTASPAAYPLVKAAEVAYDQMLAGK